MKILLVGFSKIKYMPYLDFYLKNMNPAEHEIHLIYWNRDLKPEETGHLKNVVLHEFLCAQEDNVQKSQKIASFLKFRAFAKKVLGKHRFDLVVTLHSMPAVLLKGIWTRKYKDRFIFDYRDSTYERHGFFLKMIHSLILASKATFTSSDGFRVLFPENAQNKIYTTHNLDLAALSLKKPKRISSDRIRVSYWGFIRDPKTNRALIEKFSADERFELHFFGREQKTALQLKAYAGEIGAKNVTFHGEYSPEERYDFVKNTDVIHNVYEGSNMRMAVSNKFYDGLVFQIPLLCLEGSFMGKMAQKNGVGIALDPNDPDYTQKLYDYLQGLDREKLSANCETELKRVIGEYEAASNAFKACLKAK